jgi:hypothetical protein
MKLPLKMLIEECISSYQCSDRESLENKWIIEIRMIGSDEIMKEDVLYIVPENSNTLPKLSQQSNIFLLIPFTEIETLPEGYQWVASFAQENIFKIVGAMQDIFREFQSWYLKLYDACLLGCDMQEILRISESVTQNCIYIADMSFKILACMQKEIMMEISATWRYQMSHGYLPVHVMKGMIETGEFEELNGFRKANHYYSKNFYIPFVVKNIYYNNKPQAHLFIINSMKRPSHRDIAIGQVLGEFIEKHFFLLSEFNLNRINDNHETFFNDVISGKCVDITIIQKQISIFDWNLSDIYHMAIIDVSNKDTVFIKMIMYELECETNIKSFLHDKNLVVIERKNILESENFKQILKKIANRYSLPTCMSTSFKGFIQLKEQYYILSKTTEIALKFKDHPIFYETSDYGLYYIMDYISHSLEMRQLCSGNAILLKEYDKENETEYFKTYSMYLLNDRNIVHTANVLHIHRNTLMYRLEKIKRIISIDEEKANQRIHMLLSMMLLDYEEKSN